MVRIRSGGLAFVLAFGLLGAGACKKSNKNGASGDKTAEKSGGGATAAADDLSLLPADSELVLGLNVAQLRESALWKQYSSKIMDKASDTLNEVKAACGFDPMTAITSVSIGMKGLGNHEPDGVIVVHGIEKAKITDACVAKAKASAEKDGGSLTLDGDVYIEKDKDGSTTAMTFVSGNTLLITGGTLGTKDAIKGVAKGTSGLKTSKAFLDLYSKINTKSSLWGFVNGNAPFMSKAGAMGMKPKAIYGSLNVTDGLALDARIRLGSPEEATSLVSMAKGQVDNPQVKAMFDKLEVTADGADVKAVVALSGQKLQQLAMMAGGMLGGMMGGMGAP